jgi:hypothetical protein
VAQVTSGKERAGRHRGGGFKVAAGSGAPKRKLCFF